MMVLSMDHNDQSGTRHVYHDKDYNYVKNNDENNMVFMGGETNYDHTNNNCRSSNTVATTTTTTTTSSSSSSIGEDSTVSNGSSSFEDTTDDASSYSSGSVFDLTDLMSRLPIKRGLSKFYQGKSQSFTCFSRVGSIEDLSKKGSPYNNKKRRRSLDSYKVYTLPKPVISKKTTSRPASIFIPCHKSFPNRKPSTFNSDHH